MILSVITVFQFSSQTRDSAKWRPIEISNISFLTRSAEAAREISRWLL